MTAASPEFRPQPGRGTRQRLVALYLGALLLVTLLSLRSLIGLSFDKTLLQVMYVLDLGVVLYGGWRLVRPETLGLPTTRSVTLDERQQARVTQAMATSYRVLSLLLTLAVVSFIFWGEALAPRLTEEGSGLIMVLMFLIPTLPNAVLAWTEPDADPLDA